MAIVKMKKLRVITMADRRAALLRDLLHLGCVEISEPEARGFMAVMEMEDELINSVETECNHKHASYTDKITFRNNKINCSGDEKIQAFAFKLCANVNIENNYYSENIDISTDNTN